MILLYFLLITKASSFVRTYSHYPSIKPLFDSNKIDLRDKSIVDESIGELIKDIDNGKVGGIYFVFSHMNRLFLSLFYRIIIIT